MCQKANQTTEATLYNVVCMHCDQVWTPRVESPLWWKAKQRADKGYLDALRVSGEECGCVGKRREPDAPYRVIGYTMDCQNFDIPFHTFIEAVREYREHRDGNRYSVAYITGVSPAVQHKLEFGF